MKSRFLIFILFISFSAKAQLSVQQYKAKSRKISEMVAERNAQFQEYQNSLSKKSGIFGGKTKKDLERSIELLTQTVEADNRILEETQALLNYKPVERPKTDPKQSKTALEPYQDSIQALQQKNLLLAQRAMSLKKEKNVFTTVMLLLGLAGLVLLLTAVRKTK